MSHDDADHEQVDSDGDSVANPETADTDPDDGSAVDPGMADTDSDGDSSKADDVINAYIYRTCARQSYLAI